MGTEQTCRGDDDGSGRTRSHPLAPGLDSTEPSEEFVVVCRALDAEPSGDEHHIRTGDLGEGGVDALTTADADDFTVRRTDTDQFAGAEPGFDELSEGEREGFALVHRHSRKDHERDLHSCSVAQPTP